MSSIISYLTTLLPKHKQTLASKAPFSFSSLISSSWTSLETASSPSSSSSSYSLPTVNHHLAVPTRNYWREVLRYTPNPKNPSQVQSEDPTLMALRSSRAQSAEGLLKRKSKYQRYEKPWMKRKRLKMVREYKSMEKGVHDLKLYVKYIQEAKDIYYGKAVNKDE